MADVSRERLDVREAEGEVHSLTFTSSLSSRSFSSSRFQNHSHSNTFKQSSLCLPLQESLAVKSFSSPPCLYFLIVRLPIDGGGDPAKVLPTSPLPPASCLPALLVISTRKQWRQWPSHAHKVTVARLQAPPIQQPSTFSQFPERAQGKARAPSRAL